MQSLALVFNLFEVERYLQKDRDKQFKIVGQKGREMQIEISITDLEKMCDRYCKFPNQTESQEALEAICSFCPLTQIQSLLVSEEKQYIQI